MNRYHGCRPLHVLGLTVAAILYLSGCTPPPSGGSGNVTAFSNRTTVDAEPASAVDIPRPSAVDQPPRLAQNSGLRPPDSAASVRAANLVKVDPLDWPYCRGPEYNGISCETGLVDDWDPPGGKGSNVLWKRDDLGSRGTPIVMRGKLYMLCRAEPGTPREGERVVCLDAATGKDIWKNRFNVYLSDVPDTRVGWSSVVGDPATGRVYALGVCGYFQCIDGDSGKTIWSHSMHEEFGLLSTYGGRTNFPVLCDDLVIISAVVIGWGEMAKPAHRFLAMDKNTGEVVWMNGTRLLPYDTTYSSPTVTVLAGQKALVFGSGDGAVWALQPRTGNQIWKYQFSRRGLNVPPLVVGDRVYTGHSEENIAGTAMGAVAAIDAAGRGDLTESGQLWKVKEIMAGRSSPLLVDGRLYIFDDRGKLHFLDPDTGEALVRRKALGTVMRSSPLYADGKIYAITANGRWYIMRPDEKQGVRIVNKGRLPSGHESHGSPIASHGRVYIPTTGALYCLEDTGQEHGASDRPAAPKEQPVWDDPQPAHLQLVPAEMLLRPGQKQQFTVRLFNAQGQLLPARRLPVQFSLDGPGQIGEDGTFSAPDGAQHVAVVVNATVGDLAGRVRIRIVPPLPWKFDFEDIAIDPKTGKGEPAITWVGVRYRHVIRELDGNKVMVKVSTIPKGTRSRGWMGHPDMHDYTMQADVRGAANNEQMPDIALVAQGYALDLQGNGQKLQIRTWVTQERMAKTIDFAWQPDKWYTMKLRAAIEGERAVLRGKVWPKGEQEPDQWTIEAEDTSPNLTGSPGLYGNANNAEIYLDNITVTPNQPVSPR